MSLLIEIILGAVAALSVALVMLGLFGPTVRHWMKLAND